MRKRIYSMIEVSRDNSKLSQIYDWFMMASIIISILPLTVKHPNTLFYIIDCITVSIFIIDYTLRLCTADFKLKRGWISFFLYPLTPMAIIDLISILPSFAILSSSFKLFKIFRLLRTFKVFRVFKFLRYSKSIIRIINVFKKQKDALIAVSALSIGLSDAGNGFYMCFRVVLF